MKTPIPSAKLERLNYLLDLVKQDSKLGHYTPLEAAAWITYAQIRDEAAESVRDLDPPIEEDDIDYSVAEEIEAYRDLFADGQADFEGSIEAMAGELGSTLDPDFDKPIDPKTHKSWIA